MIRLGFRDFKRNFLLNILVVLLLMIVFAVTISGISAVAGRMKTYNKIRPYLEQPGVFMWADILTYGADNYMYKDPDELRQYLSNVQDVLSVTRWLATTYQGKDIEVWEYSQEVVEMLSPEMEQGRYFSKQDIYSNTLKGVISQNTMGIQVGDIVRIDDGMIKDCYQEIEIIGVMQDGVTLYQPSYYGEDLEDYRQCFQPYNVEVEGNKPVILVAGQQILANQSKGLFSKVNHRLGDLGFMRQITGPVVITYSKGTKEDQIDTDLATACGSATSIIRQYTLEEFNQNSKKYIFGDIYNLLPVIICAFVFILIASISAGVISVKKNMYNYAIYYICGLQWKQCARISLYTSMMVTMIAFLFDCGAITLLQIVGRLEGTMLSIGIWQLLVSAGIGVVFVLVSWMLPMFLVRNMSAERVLRDNRE